MRAYLRKLWAAAPIATVILALALVATLFFGVRLAIDALDGEGPRNTPVAIEPWMTPRFVSHTWQVPRKEMSQFLALELNEAPKKGEPRSLKDLAASRDMPVETLIADLETFVKTYRAEQIRPQVRPEE